MKRNFSASDVMELSVAERIELVEDLWDSIAEVPESVELTEEQKKTLSERLNAYHKNPDDGSPWDEVKKRIKAGK
jgi:putative addiction module component (TIGR02574 family)